MYMFPTKITAHQGYSLAPISSRPRGIQRQGLGGKYSELFVRHIAKGSRVIMPSSHVDHRLIKSNSHTYMRLPLRRQF